MKRFYSFESKNKNTVSVKEVQLKVEEERNVILPVCFIQYRKKLPPKVDWNNDQKKRLHVQIKIGVIF